MKTEGTAQNGSKARRNGMMLILLFSALSLTWGIFLTRTIHGGVLDFQGVYYGTECLIQHCDPYSETQLEAFYKSKGLDDPTETVQRRQVKTLYVNVPTTFLVVAPFTLLPWAAASVLWFSLIAGCFILAAMLMWDIGARYSPGVATLLVVIVMANSEVVFATGNTAGLVVAFTVIAVWCFLEERFAPIGMLCMVAALSMKPHDAGLVWLYFLFAGGVQRKRALTCFLATFVLAVGAFLWVQHAVPHWLPEMRTNLAAISGRGGLNEPGPSSVTSHSAGMVVDLQAAVSVFWDDPRVYNLVSYAICGAMLALWSVKALRSPFSTTTAWVALAAIAPLTMLVTYHRPYDAKLLLLTVPACAMLWKDGGSIGRWAVALSAAGVFFTGDVPLASMVVIYNDVASTTSGLTAKIVTVLLTRPASLILLAVACFYLWVYVRGRSAGAGASTSA
jgi:hypothetical protein